MNVLIDYLTLTSKIHDFLVFWEKLGLVGCAVVEMPGRYGWSLRKYYRGVSVLYGGNRDDVCLEISGTGCRTVEEISGNTFDWLAFLRFFEDDLIYGDVNISRLDIAGDDREGVLNYHRMTLHCSHRRYICKARWRMWTDGDEQCIYFGAPSSDRRLRIYNKGLEQGIEDHWIRVEMQMRDDNAISFVLNWYRSQDVGFCFASVLRDYLRFTVSVPDRHHYELAVECLWWSRFIGAVGSCRQLYLDGGKFTLWHVQHYIETQSASSLKCFLAAHNGDMEDLIAIIERAKLNKRQLMLLDSIQKNGGNGNV